MTATIVFIERLDPLSLPLALCHRAVGGKVFYKELSPLFRGRRLEGFLAKGGISAFNFFGRSGALYTSFLNAHRDAVDLAFSRRIRHHFIYEQLRRELPDVDPEVISTTVKASVFNNQHLSYGTSSVPLIDLLIKDHAASGTKMKIIPRTVPGSILLDAYYREAPGVSVSALHAGAHLFIGSAAIIRRAASRIVRALKPARQTTAAAPAAKSRNPYDATILYFPHQSLKYGRFFKKTYVFSPTFPDDEKLCLLWTPDCVQELSRRYIRRFKLPALSVRGPGIAPETTALLKSCAMARGLSVFADAFIGLELLRFYNRFRSASHFFSRFRAARTAYAHYDTLLPPHMVLALTSRGIVTIGLQDRLFQYPYFPNIYFDCHLVAGPALAPQMQAFGDCSKQMIPVGLPRASDARKGHSWVNQRIKDMAGHRRVVVCFGLFPLTDHDVGVYGEDGTSRASNYDFLETALEMAETLPDDFYYVRVKETDFIEQGFAAELVQRIQAKDNMHLDLNIRQMSSYDLIAAADVVIGKLSMIMEEARAAGKPAIYYDPERYVEGIGFRPTRILSRPTAPNCSTSCAGFPPRKTVRPAARSSSPIIPLPCPADMTG